MFRIRATKHNPCPLCGVTDWDMQIVNDDNTRSVFCRKTSAQKGDILMGKDGLQYKCTAVDCQIDSGLFNVFREYLPKEEWMQRKAAMDPSFRKPMVDYDKPVQGEAVVKSNKECDTFYRTLLSLLVLEEKHKKSLLAEWESSIHNMEHLLTDYPIRSLPPYDKDRYASREKFSNPNRKQLIAKLVEVFGEDLSGYPGMYLRTGKYWDEKPVVERWTIAGEEGTLFPCFDKDGYLYRLRIKCDYPDVKIEEGHYDSYHGMYGTFSHRYDEVGKHTWWFYPSNSDSKPLVAADVTLKSNGLPVGKTVGKYKTISSLSRKRNEAGEEYNGMHLGCRSGSPYSLYTRPGDNYTVVIGTEGEKKGMVANAIKGNPLLTVPGVGSFRQLFEKGEDGLSVMDHLKNRGMKAFLLCYDADKETNHNVMKAQDAFVARLKEEGIQPLIGNWKSQFDKGIDDILLMGVDIQIQRV